jgi:hypothetical protein
MSAVTVAIAVTGCVVACNVDVVMLGYSYETAKLRAQETAKQALVATIVKDVVWLAITKMMETPSSNGRRRERVHAR